MTALSDFDPDNTSATVRAQLPDSMSAQLQQDDEEQAQQQRPCMFSLFWRTFFLIGLLLLGSAIGWYKLFRQLEYEPRIVESTRQVASLVNLTRAALAHADAGERASLVKTLSQQEKVHIQARKPGDRYEPLAAAGGLEERASNELGDLLGPGTLAAGSVNGAPGLWVGFSIDGDDYWLQTDSSRLGIPWGGITWTLWLITLVALSLLGAALLARRINRPLHQLLIAAARVREGNYQERLDENIRLCEIRQVNIGFNRMAERIFRAERNRAEMLAGVSHDLRTPLARLRLETEMSVPDAEARELMAADIAQADAIIEKFLEYARPGRTTLQLLPLADLARACAQPFIALEDMEVRIEIPPDLRILGDETDFSRMLSNLLENARRHGQTPGEKITRVRITAVERNQVVTLRVRDYGPGVAPEQLNKITRPFYRGDRARTAALGTGLGLAIVAKVVHGMNGVLEFGNSPTGGLIVLIRLPQKTESRRAG